MNKRYETAEWKELVSIQNEFYPNQDILTITGFMSEAQFIAHVESYRSSAKSKK